LFHSHGISPKDFPARSATVFAGDTLYKFEEARRSLPLPHKKKHHTKKFFVQYVNKFHKLVKIRKGQNMALSGRTKISDIASRLGVSTATVSRALSGNGMSANISPPESGLRPLK